MAEGGIEGQDAVASDCSTLAAFHEELTSRMEQEYRGLILDCLPVRENRMFRRRVSPVLQADVDSAVEIGYWRWLQSCVADFGSGESEPLNGLCASTGWLSSAGRIRDLPRGERVSLWVELLLRQCPVCVVDEADLGEEPAEVSAVSRAVVLAVQHVRQAYGALIADLLRVTIARMLDQVRAQADLRLLTARPGRPFSRPVVTTPRIPRGPSVFCSPRLLTG